MQPGGAAQPYPTRSSSFSSAAMGSGQDPAKRKKMIAMAAGAVAVAVGAIVILVLTLSGQDKQPPAQAVTGSGSEGSSIAIKATPSVDAAEAEPAESQQVVDKVGSGSETAPPRAVPADAAVEQVVEQPKPPVEQPKPAGGPCTVQVTSVPVGADVYADKQKVGTTPAKLELTCGNETRLSLRKAKFANTVKTITPQAGKANKFTIKLARNQFSVKVTSTPAGATITAGGKAMGVTPTTIKLPAYDASTITLTKPGYAPDKSRVSPKQNNASHHVTLKRGR